MRRSLGAHESLCDVDFWSAMSCVSSSGSDYAVEVDGFDVVVLLVGQRDVVQQGLVVVVVVGPARCGGPELFAGWLDHEVSIPAAQRGRPASEHPAAASVDAVVVVEGPERPTAVDPPPPTRRITRRLRRVEQQSSSADSLPQEPWREGGFRSDRDVVGAEFG